MGGCDMWVCCYLVAVVVDRSRVVAGGKMRDVVDD